MSVAVGIAHPDIANGLSKLINTYTRAGTAIPPTAAIPGKRTFFTDDSCPLIISLLSSKPITKKNIAISPSFTK